jgi:hypothetical protein
LARRLQKTWHQREQSSESKDGGDAVVTESAAEKTLAWWSQEKIFDEIKNFI